MTNTQPDDLFQFPASFGQEQLWYLHELDPGSTAYNIALAFDIGGDLNGAALQAALGALIQRHEALRTGFAVVDEQLRQIVRGRVPFRLVTVDLGGIAHDERDRRLAALKHACARHRFDLAQAPLLSVRLVRMEPRRHVLLLCIHHIIVDHLSVLQIGRELGELYAACRDGAPVAVDDDRLQFPDYAVWQREQMDEEALAQRLECWDQLLGAGSQTLDLPTDRPRPAVQSFAGDELSVYLPRDLSGALRRHAQREKQSLFVAVLGALSVVLHKYSGHSGLIVGCPMANRPTDEMHDVVGLFMNVLPVPVDVDPEQRFGQFAEHVRRQVTRTQALQDTPFEKIVRAGGGAHSASHNPLVQVWFTFQDAPLALEIPGLEVASEPLHNGGSKLDLSVWFWDDGVRIRGLIEYNTDLFDAATVRQFSGHLVQVLRQVTENPEIRVADLSLLTDSDRDLLQARRVEAMQAQALTSMHEAFFARAVEQPDRVVLTTAAGDVTAGRLAARADAMACELRRRGVSPGDIVAACLERDESLPAALLGVLRCGAAYLPLDPTLPAERIGYMLDDSGVQLAIATPATRDVLPASGIAIVDADAAIDDAPPGFVAHAPGAEELAYLIYTSGSTGQPKGVRIVHGAVGNFLSAMQHRPGIEEDDVVLALTMCGFDISVLELFLPLVAGARVRLADRATAENGSALQQLIDAGGITMMQATPSTWRLLRASGWEGKAGLKALVGGESLPPELARWLLPRVDELWNMYGPTETTIWSSCARIDEHSSATCPIGQPIWNTTIQVVDEHLQLLPAGVAGELVIGGRGVSPGYLDRAELTAQRFIRLPETGEAVYRTGDRGLWRDGQLHHLGRSDNQVKIRGHRIELGEVEAVLERLPELDVVAARVWCIDDADHRLVAYYSSRSGAPVSVDRLREHARGFLPNYMLPQHFMQLASIPLLPNGKIDRNALPTPVTRMPEQAAVTDEAALTSQQRLVLGACRDLIGDESIELDDNFFDAGGHSLLALTLMGRIEKKTGVRLTIIRIASSSLRSLADELREDDDEPPPGDDPWLGARLGQWVRNNLTARRAVSP